jgi:hypothetical protein
MKRRTSPIAYTCILTVDNVQIIFPIMYLSCSDTTVVLCLVSLDYSSRRLIACFKVTAESYNVAIQTAEPKRVKTDQNSQRSKSSNAALATLSRAVRKSWGGGGLKSFRGLEEWHFEHLLCTLGLQELSPQSDVLLAWLLHYVMERRLTVHDAHLPIGRFSRCSYRHTGDITPVRWPYESLS